MSIDGCGRARPIESNSQEDGEQQAAVGDHELERKRRNRQQVVHVEPRPLTARKSEGEKVGKDPLVGDDAGDEADEQHHGDDGHEIETDLPRQIVQSVVHLVQRLRAGCIAGLRERGSRINIQNHIVKFPASAVLGLGFFPKHSEVRCLAPLCRTNEPTHCTLCMNSQVILSDLNGVIGGYLLRGRRLWGHPLINFCIEVAEGSGHKHEVKNPAKDQAGPGVQPRHGLPK